jgi:hypothetical protein
VDYMTLMPSLARAPEEAVASNAARGRMEGTSTLIGPPIGDNLRRTRRVVGFVSVLAY